MEINDSAPAVSEEETYETDNQTVYVRDIDSLTVYVHASDCRCRCGGEPVGQIG